MQFFQSLQKHPVIIFVCCLMASVTCGFFNAFAQETVPNLVQRELYVPLEDLPIILSGPNERIMMTRKEYDELLSKAKPVKQAEQAPYDAIILSAHYETEVGSKFATIQGNITFEAMKSGPFLFPLDLNAVGLNKATINGNPAAFVLGAEGNPSLVVQETGIQRLEFSLLSPIVTAANLQTLDFRLPVVAESSMQLKVPGNVEIKAGRRSFQGICSPRKERISRTSPSF